MGGIAELKEKRSELLKITPKVKWDEIKGKDIYHVPPIICIQRKDLEIVDVPSARIKIKYKIASSSTTSTISEMGKLSIMSNFIVKKRKF